jgi:hypothetical protein
VRFVTDVEQCGFISACLWAWLATVGAVVLIALGRSMDLSLGYRLGGGCVF